MVHTRGVYSCYCCAYLRATRKIRLQCLQHNKHGINFAAVVSHCTEKDLSLNSRTYASYRSPVLRLVWLGQSRLCAQTSEELRRRLWWKLSPSGLLSGLGVSQSTRADKSNNSRSCTSDDMPCMSTTNSAIDILSSSVATSSSSSRADLTSSDLENKTRR